MRFKEYYLKNPSLTDVQEVFGDKPEEKLEVLKTRLQRAGTGKKAP